jgi:hypothetical protein
MIEAHELTKRYGDTIAVDSMVAALKAEGSDGSGHVGGTALG